MIELALFNEILRLILVNWLKFVWISALVDDVSRRYKSRDYKEVSSEGSIEEGKEEDEKKSR